MHALHTPAMLEYNAKGLRKECQWHIPINTLRGKHRQAMRSAKAFFQRCQPTDQTRARDKG